MGPIVKTVLSLLLLTFLSIGANAQAPRVDSIKIVDYGLYTNNVTAKESAPNVPGGSRNIVKEIRHAATTRTVPAQQGVVFGFNFTVVGAPAGTVVPLHMVDVYPPPGLRDPATQKLSDHAEYNRTATIGSQTFTSYGFDHDWELVPGVWTIQIWYEGRKLAEQQFTVVKQ
jgi:Domain of unknown function (DUF3859)